MTIISHGEPIDWRKIEYNKIKEESIEQLEERIVSVTKKRWEIQKKIDDNSREANELREQLQWAESQLNMIQCIMVPLTPYKK